MFLIEDGSGVAGANSYATTLEYKNYFQDRGVEVTQGSSDLEKLLVRATDYIEQRWGLLFMGLRQYACQSLSFPRTSLVTREGNPVTGIPDKLKAATFEYALQALNGDLLPVPITATAGVTSLRKKVGPIEVETRYSDTAAASASASAATAPVYPAGDRLLAEYVSSGGTPVRA